MEPLETMKESSERPAPNAPEIAGQKAAGLFELELPSGPGLNSIPRPVSLEQAIALCQEYRRWFGLDRRAASQPPDARCAVEFVL